VSKKRSCRLALLQRAPFYYRSRAKDQSVLRMRIRELAHSRPRFGYERIYILLRREIAALALTYASLALEFAHSLDGEQKNFWLDAALAFASSICYALYLVAGADVITRMYMGSRWPC
jgi:hypothetical protein